MMPARPQRSRPLMAVLTSPLELSPMALAPLAAGRYELLWLVDSTPPVHRHVAAVHAAMLRKLGDVVHLEGLPTSQAATAIRRHRPDGIVTFQDAGMLRLAEIAAELELPFHTPKVAERLVDKFVQRRALHQGGVAVPRYAEVPPSGDCAALADIESRISFPAVLKPRHGTGSENVVSVPSFPHLLEALSQLSRDGIGEAMLVEEFIPAAPSRDEQIAPVVSVESYVSGGRVSNVAMTGRFRFVEPFRETGNFMPAELSDEDGAAVLQLAVDAARALEIESGCLHTEIKLAPSGPRLIEVNGRPGGGIPEMIGRLSKLDLYDVGCRLALGEQLPHERLLQMDRVVFRSVIQAPMSAHRVLSLQGFDEAATFPGVEHLLLNRGPGQSVDWRKGYRDFVFAAEGTVDDVAELRALDRRLREEVSVVYE